MKLFLKISILIVALLITVKSCGPYLGGQNALLGQPAPDFTVETLSGQQKNMTQFRGGQPAIIFFWATWCPHCREQLKELTQQRDQIEEKGIKIILVDVGEGAQTVGAYVTTNGITFDVFLDQDTALSEEYQLVGVPTFFFIDKGGVVAAVEHFLPDNYEEILLGLAL